MSVPNLTKKKNYQPDENAKIKKKTQTERFVTNKIWKIYFPLSIQFILVSDKQ